ncbi:MAG TPA: zinc ribbon domain-containing protein [Pyrinomonadaceae bacterium]|jgi:hypothetical protein|nr:zinc ribbon domain-containing protein [Pyrinomonadaceae bacterium]
MFCPNCGANNSTDQKFCRTCGLNLEKAAESLTEQFPESGKADLARQQRMLEKFGSLAMCGFGVVLVMGVGALLYTIITKLIIPGPAGNVMTGIFMIAFIIFATLLLAYVIFNEMLKDKKQKINVNMEKELAASKDTGKLLDEGYLQPVSGITENTTDLLYDKSRTQKL